MAHLDVSKTLSRSFAGVFAVALASTTVAAFAAGTTATAVPGGANELSGVSGSFSQVLFNGQLRLRGMALRSPSAADKAQPKFGLGNLVFVATVSNGEQRRNYGYFDATLSDANGITIAGGLLDDGWDLEPGAAAHTSYVFKVPNDFVPAKLVLVQPNRAHAKAFRLTIRSSDLPPTPAATP